HQPMSDLSGQFTVVFNGELYNYLELRAELVSNGHRFKTRSDTEVLLEAYRCWGEKFIDKLNGTFAFAIYDSVKNSLFMARDRAGEKPFFYWYSGNTFIFASELKALMAFPSFPRKLSLDAMNAYLTYGYVPRDMCMLQGVRKLPQGHALLFDREQNRLRTWAYWALPEPAITKNASTSELLWEFEKLLTDSVQRQLVADVPVGVLLSGGIDSSLITAVASRVSTKKVKTFTISFPGSKSFNEAPYAKIVADHFGTEHTVLPAEVATVELLPQLAKQFDEPLADSSMVPTYLVSQLIRRYATVAVGGDGGDELFGGYLHYKWLQYQESARKLLSPAVRSIISSGAETFLPVGLRGRNYMQGVNGTLQNSFAYVNRFFDVKARHDVFTAFGGYGPDTIARGEQYKAKLALPGDTTVQKGMASDFMTYLPDDILAKVDKVSMLSSLEVRAPFLDYRMVEFAFSKVPDSLRVTGSKRKVLPKMLAKKLLPPNLDISRKQGFSIPLDQWMRGDWGEYMKSVLLDPESCFNKDAVTHLFKLQQCGFSNSQRIFALTMFELWRRQYNIEIP
ncbi:MAG: asparagine synthase (glutamine-hydrolyzing), partial [Elusimicrobiota bacterium]|nr:asparagine synthase (glutamine-hydrolyzing) [Elusimicrobiota bacterium]